MSRFIYESLPGHASGLSIHSDHEQIATARMCFEIGKPAAVLIADGVVLPYTIDLISDSIDEKYCVQEFLNDHLQHEAYRDVRILAAGRVSIVRKGSTIFVSVGQVWISSISTHAFSTNWIVEDNSGEVPCDYYLDMVHESLLLDKLSLKALIAATMSLRKYYGLRST